MPTPCPWSWLDPHALSYASSFPQVVAFISPRTLELVNETEHSTLQVRTAQTLRGADRNLAPSRCHSVPVPHLDGCWRTGSPSYRGPKAHPPDHSALIPLQGRTKSGKKFQAVGLAQVKAELPALTKDAFEQLSERVGAFPSGAPVTMACRVGLAWMMVTALPAQDARTPVRRKSPYAGVCNPQWGPGDRRCQNCWKSFESETV